jgi:hypothetical protein
MKKPNVAAIPAKRSKPVPFEPVHHPRTDSAEAFVPDPTETRHRAADEDPLAEMLGEDYVQAATSGESTYADVADAVTMEELGGPFLESSSADEIADDEPETPEATREPFPTPHGRNVRVS